MLKLDLKQGKNIYLIGLTGNIACGKSAVLKMLAERGAAVIDADSAIHRIMQPGGSAYAPIIARFGENILADSQPEPRPIDRRKLGAIVFPNPDELHALEAISHPLVRVEILRQIAEATPPIVVLDAIKLIENGLADASDSVWVVTCPPEVQLERLMKRNNFSEEEALIRIKAQPLQAEKVARADVVIDNGGSLTDTEAQVEAAWGKIPGKKPGVRSQESE
jgi:dephospho-CoA kinase